MEITEEEFREALEDLIERGLIESITVDGEECIQITDDGIKKLEESLEDGDDGS